MKRLLWMGALLLTTAGSVMAQQTGSGWANEPESNVWSLLRANAVQNDLGLSDEAASKLDSLFADSEAALKKE